MEDEDFNLLLAMAAEAEAAEEPSPSMPATNTVSTDASPASVSLESSLNAKRKMPPSPTPADAVKKARCSPSSHHDSGPAPETTATSSKAVLQTSNVHAAAFQPVSGKFAREAAAQKRELNKRLSTEKIVEKHSGLRVYC